MNSESFSCAGKMPERRTAQIETPIVGNSQPIAKIGNAELAYFNKQMLIHELIRGSLVNSVGLNRPQSFNLKPSWVAWNPSDS